MKAFRIVASSVLCAVQVLLVSSGWAQLIVNPAADMTMAILNATTMQVNPSFTGMFHGGLRAGLAYYKSQSLSIGNSIRTSVDMPVSVFKNGSYLAAGLQVDQANGMPYVGLFGNRDVDDVFAPASSEAVLSAAYHIPLRGTRLGGLFRNSEIGVGVQSGFAKIKYAPIFTPTLSAKGYSRSGVPLHSGVSFSKATSFGLSYTLGVSFQNLNQATWEPLTEGQSKYNSRNRNTVLTAGATWVFTPRFSLRPAIFYASSSNFSQVVLGTEAHFIVKKPDNKQKTALFAGLWKEEENNYYLSLGMQLNNCRLAFSVEQDFHDLELYSYQLAFRCQPQFQLGKHRRVVSCDRF